MKITDASQSPEVREIIEKKPNFIIRWGNGLVGLFICLLLTFSWFITYQDVISVPVYISKDGNGSIGFLEIPSENIENIKIGQQITATFGNYPYEKSWEVTGQIKSIKAPNPKNEKSTVIVVFNKPDALTGQISGTTEIKWKERLLTRLLYPLRKGI